MHESPPVLFLYRQLLKSYDKWWIRN